MYHVLVYGGLYVAAFIAAVVAVRHRKVHLIGVIILGIAPFVLGYIYAVPHCVPASKLSDVTEGVTQSDEVVALLGPPTSEIRLNVGREMRYAKPFRFCEVIIDIDGQERVKLVRHRHMRL
jgi:hypothetical protein